MKPGSATKPLPGVQAAAGRCRAQGARRRRQRQPLHRRVLAGADAHRLGRPRALLRDLFQGLSRPLFHRRRLPPRRGRLLLDHRPRRRRDQRLRPPHRHRRSRKLAGQPSQGRRGRGRRLPARHQGPGDLRLRHAERRRRRRRRAAQGARRRKSATTSARSPRPRRSSSRPRFPRPARARSCAASCARSRKARPSGFGDTSTLADPTIVDALVAGRQ